MCSVVTNPKIETLAQLNDAWARLEDVLVCKNKERTEEEFEFNGLTYEVGTVLEDIWHKFDEVFAEKFVMEGCQGWFHYLEGDFDEE